MFMALETIPCPLCEEETQINLPNIQIGKQTRTYTCQKCKRSIILEMTLKPAPGSNLHKNKDWLRERYVVQEKTLQEVADMCGVTAMTIRDWLQRHDLPVRSRGARV